MSDDIVPLLKVHDYFQGVSDTALVDLLQHARVSHWTPGDVLHEPDRVCDKVEFVLRGRLKAVRLDTRGDESLFRMIERGEQFGMMLDAPGEPAPLRVIALEPSTVLSLDHEAAFDLTQRHLDLRRQWLTTFAGHLRRFTLGVAARKAPMLLALVHASAAATPVVGQLLARLSQLGETLDHGDKGWRGVPQESSSARASRRRTSGPTGQGSGGNGRLLGTVTSTDQVRPWRTTSGNPHRTWTPRL